jgi:hypothetical protein
VTRQILTNLVLLEKVEWNDDEATPPGNSRDDDGQRVGEVHPGDDTMRLQPQRDDDVQLLPKTKA